MDKKINSEDKPFLDAFRAALSQPIEDKKYSLDDLYNVWDAAKSGKNLINNATGNIRYEEKYLKFEDFFKEYKPIEDKESEDELWSELIDKSRSHNSSALVSIVELNKFKNQFTIKRKP